MPFEQRIFRFVTVMLLGLPASVSFAADWTLTPRINLIETFTDNLSLAPAGQEESELISQLNPAFSLVGDGRRVKLDAGYNMQNLFYADNSDRNRTHHQFSAGVRSELIEDWFYLDWNGQLSQQLIDPQTGIVNDNLNLVGTGRGDVITTSISPQLRGTLHRDIDLSLVLTEGWVFYETPGVADSSTQNVTASIGRSRDVVGIDWQLLASEHKTERDNLSDFETRSSQARIGLPILPDVRLVAYTGREEGKVSSSRNFREGSYWSAGIYWRPSPKLSLELTKGDKDEQQHLTYAPTSRTNLSLSHVSRDVGIRPSSTWAADLSHRTRRTVWSLGYSEHITSDSILAIVGQQLGPLVQNGQIVFDEQGLPVIVLYHLIGIVDEEFVRAVSRAGVTYTRGKSTLRLSLTDETRDYELTARHAESQSAQVGWKWKFAPRTSLDVSHSLTRSEEIAFGKREITVNNLSVSRSIGRQAKGQLGWRQTEVDQGSALVDYLENRITASLSLTF